VVGASGYAGAELVTILAGHPEVEIVSIHADSHSGSRWEDLYPGWRHVYQGDILPLEYERLFRCDVVFLALPHGASAAAASRLEGKGPLIVDLSGDMRLNDVDSYRRWYGMEHSAPHLLGKATYGLPELFREDLAETEMVACAGCYATVSQIAAAPALAMGEGIGTRVAISALSGTSGAGRKADVALNFSQVHGDLRAYRVGRHQHAPEISAGLSRYAKRKIDLTFVPHLVPIDRGILATVLLPNPGGHEAGEVLAAYVETYDSAPFVRVVDPAVRLPSVKDVTGTNFCDVAPTVDEVGGSIVVVGVIDNLVKGAAGQAVQVMNLVCGLEETLGLVKE